MSDQTINIALRFETRIRNAVIRAFNGIRSQVVIDDLTDIIKAEGVAGALRILRDLQIEGFVDKEVIGEINDEVAETGKTIFAFLPAATLTGLVFNYSILEPSTANMIRDYNFGLIQSISQNTREAIKNSVAASILDGDDYIDTAKTFKDTIGLTPKQEQVVRNYKTNLQTLDYYALDRRLRDKRFDTTIRRAIDNNTPLTKDQIDKMVSSYRIRYIKHRAETIARTESMRAMALGEYTSGIQAANSGALDVDKTRRFWIHMDDNRTRNHHRQIPGLNSEGVAVDGTFITPLGPLRFPRDPRGTASNTVNCRCIVEYREI
jgi:hypothetical protein